MSDEVLLLNKSWLAWLNLSPFLRKKLATLIKKVDERRAIATIYPPQSLIMHWSHLCSPSDIKVIILGQDPYHGGQATGLAFSVKRGVAIPPSLLNVFKELQRTHPTFEIPTDGCLDAWAKQGVLLLNTILTVEHGQAGSHATFGWLWFTNYIIQAISDKHRHCVFMLWGAKAIQKAHLINPQHHLVLKAKHPSPLALCSSNRSDVSNFIGCGHFEAANRYLQEHSRGIINWNLY